MSAPRRVPLLRWEPLPFLVLLVLALGTGVVRPDGPAPLFWAYNALLVAVVIWVLVVVLRPDPARNPDRWGSFESLEHAELVDAPAAVDRELQTLVPVDVQRRQSKIDLARIAAGPSQHAVLVPRSRRWLSPRYRVGVVLEGGGKPRQGGYLQPAADERRREQLDALAQQGRYVRVPVRITGDQQPYGLDLDLSGLDDLDALDPA
ncbi:hypothetical protein [Agromyces seonyuensis]|uniref:Uncharacterized protein n=1 Tax=Agromyces seonyuensis TaxID=2662446 RepID=A0A6I4NUP0_9MICO|nr:hypothetical protein [Agromyces seonyuensis]MWB98010.1 hypothetical protein [Agromyces seonyuensis]